MKIEKPWGHEIIHQTNEFYTVKELYMKAGHKCSIQYHNEKMETIFVLKGDLTIHVGPSLNELKTIVLNKDNPIITILPGTVHRMEAIENDATYLECSTSQLNDVIRLVDDYNRV